MILEDGDTPFGKRARSLMEKASKLARNPRTL
jgi:hypothetical protein